MANNAAFIDSNNLYNLKYVSFISRMKNKLEYLLKRP